MWIIPQQFSFNSRTVKNFTGLYHCPNVLAHQCPWPSDQLMTYITAVKFSTAISYLAGWVQCNNKHFSSLFLQHVCIEGKCIKRRSFIDVESQASTGLSLNFASEQPVLLEFRDFHKCNWISDILILGDYDWAHYPKACCEVDGVSSYVGFVVTAPIWGKLWMVFLRHGASSIFFPKFYWAKVLLAHWSRFHKGASEKLRKRAYDLSPDWVDS